MFLLNQIVDGLSEHPAKNVNRGAQCKSVDRVCEFRHGFSFPWLLSMARKRPGLYDAGVNGLHGHSARAPVDDGGRPGKLSPNLTTSQGKGEIAAVLGHCCPRALASAASRKSRAWSKESLWVTRSSTADTITGAGRLLTDRRARSGPRDVEGNHAKSEVRQIHPKLCRCAVRETRDVAGLRSGSEQRHAQSLSGFDEVPVQGGERQFPALREFEIGSVVQGEPVAFSQPGRGRPCLVSGFRIQRDGQAAQKAREALPLLGVEALSAFGHQKPVQGLQRPQGGSDSAGFSDAVQKVHDR